MPGGLGDPGGRKRSRESEGDAADMLTRFFPRANVRAMGGEPVCQVGSNLAAFEESLTRDSSLVSRLEQECHRDYTVLKLCLMSTQPPPRLSLVEKVLRAHPDSIKCKGILNEFLVNQHGGYGNYVKCKKDPEYDCEDTTKIVKLLVQLDPCHGSTPSRQEFRCLTDFPLGNAENVEEIHFLAAQHPPAIPYVLLQLLHSGLFNRMDKEVNQQALICEAFHHQESRNMPAILTTKTSFWEIDRSSFLEDLWIEEKFEADEQNGKIYLEYHLRPESQLELQRSALNVLVQCTYSLLSERQTIAVDMEPKKCLEIMVTKGWIPQLVADAYPKDNGHLQA